MSFFAPRKAGRNRLNRAGYLTASFVSSLDNTASIACVRFRARSPNLRPLLLSFSPLFPLYNAPFLSIILSARLGAHSADLAAQSGALIIPQRTPIEARLTIRQRGSPLRPPANPLSQNFPAAHALLLSALLPYYIFIHIKIAEWHAFASSRRPDLRPRFCHFPLPFPLCVLPISRLAFICARSMPQEYRLRLSVRFDRSFRSSFAYRYYDQYSACASASKFYRRCVFVMLVRKIKNEHTYAGTCHFTEHNV